MSDLQKLMGEIARRCPGGVLPKDYLVIDLETSGFRWNPKPGYKPDVIVQVGYAAAQDGKIVSNNAHYLRRPAGTMTSEAERVTRITDGMLQQFGEPPMEFYERFLKLLNLYIDNRCMIVGHNAISFDMPFLIAELGRQGVSFDYSPECLIDTGCLFKAVQLGTLPGPTETLGMFLKRVRNTHSRVKWKLSYAMSTLDLDREFDLDLEQAHDAGFDCYMTHLLFEKLRNADAGDAFERLCNERPTQNR